MSRSTQRERNEAIRIILKEIRTKKGLSKNQVIELSGVDVSKYESGQCYPKLDAIESLCEVYEIHPRIFLMVMDVYANSDVSRESVLKLLMDHADLKKSVEWVYTKIEMKIEKYG